MIRIISTGDFRRSLTWLDSIRSKNLFGALSSEGSKGAKALASATPVDTGKTAGSWNYKVEITGSGASISWTNKNVVAGEPLVILLQYGHGTGTGGFVAGRDFINPAIQPVMDEIANNVWKKVTSG